MAISREKKEKNLANYQDILSAANSVIFIRTSGLGAKENFSLRQSLKDLEVNFLVVKKTLLNLALNKITIEGQKPELTQEIAIAYGDCPTSPARETYKFQKSLKNKVQLIGGIFMGTYKSQDEILEISKIPDITTLRGQFVNIINSPIQRTVIALSKIAETKIN